MNLEKLTTREKIKIYGQEIIDLYLAGHTTRSIATKFKIPAHDTISSFLKQNGVEIRQWKVPIAWVDECNIRCSRCSIVKHKNQFPFSKSKTREGYYFSYCKDCRAKQAKLNRLNKSDDFSERCAKIKMRAEKLGIKFDLTPEYLKELFLIQGGKCFYTDVDMTLQLGNGIKQSSCSVDKVIPENGYVKTNIVLCTIRANTIKHDISLEEMKMWLPTWHQRVVEKFGDF